MANRYSNRIDILRAFQNIFNKFNKHVTTYMSTQKGTSGHSRFMSVYALIA